MAERKVKNIILPYGFKPRSYQMPILRALDSGIKSALAVWHRRSGKDLTIMNYAIKCMWPGVDAPNGRVGTYYHLFPTYAQGKKIIWDGIDDTGRPFLDYFPVELYPTKRRNETELRLEATNGSAYQIVGTDKLDMIVGTNPVGCIFSEYAIQNPRAKDLLVPIIVQNGGWMVFIYTPRGHNHGWDLWDKNRRSSDWFAELLTIDDTKRDDGTPVISKEAVEKAVREGMDPELARQEFYCSFDIGQAGSYYGTLIEQAEKAGRITSIPHDPALLVDTWWDLGMDDCTAIWFTQQYGKEIRVIRYYEKSGEGLPFYASLLWELKKDHRYNYGAFNFPHDIEVRELGTGKSRKEIAENLGMRPARTIAKLHVQDGIAAARTVIPTCYFDKTNCYTGIEALRNYHKEYDEKRRVYMQEPCHDWSSHAADAFRTLAVGIKRGAEDRTPRQDFAETAYNPFSPPEVKDPWREDYAETSYDIFGR